MLSSDLSLDTPSAFGRPASEREGRPWIDDSDVFLVADLVKNGDSGLFSKGDALREGGIRVRAEGRERKSGRE